MKRVWVLVFQNSLVIDGSSPLSFNALNHSTRSKMALYMILENKLDIDNNTDIISSHTGGGGGGWRCRRRVNFDNPGFSHLFFSFSELIGTSLENKKAPPELIRAPPPSVIISEGGGGGCRRERSRHGQGPVVSWTRAMHDLGISSVKLCKIYVRFNAFRSRFASKWTCIL